MADATADTVVVIWNKRQLDKRGAEGGEGVEGAHFHIDICVTAHKSEA